MLESRFEMGTTVHWIANKLEVAKVRHRNLQNLVDSPDSSVARAWDARRDPIEEVITKRVASSCVPRPRLTNDLWNQVQVEDRPQEVSDSAKLRVLPDLFNVGLR